MVSENLLTVSLTVIVGVTVYALSQIVSKFFIEPIHKQDEIRGEIADAVDYYANIYTNPGDTGIPDELKTETATVLRQKATLLQSKTHLIRLYGVFSRLGFVPSRKHVNKASGRLIGLSNQIFDGDPMRNYQWAEDVKILLKLKGGKKMENKQGARERAYMFWGAIMGIALGIFGNLFASYFYDVYQTKRWMPYVAWGSFVFVLLILGYLTFYMIRWLRQAQ